MTVDEALLVLDLPDAVGDKQYALAVATLRRYVERVREIEGTFLSASDHGSQMVAHQLAAAREGRDE